MVPSIDRSQEVTSSHSSDLVPATEDIPERVHRVPPPQPSIYHQISSYRLDVLHSVHFCILILSLPYVWIHHQFRPCSSWYSLRNLWPVISLQKLVGFFSRLASLHINLYNRFRNKWCTCTLAFPLDYCAADFCLSPFLALGSMPVVRIQE